MSKRKHAIEAYFQTGVGLHRSGRLGEAEQIYRQVLAAAPSHADSLHMLGVLASQSGQLETALTWIDRAIAARPAAALFYVNRAATLLGLRQLDAARRACHDALRVKRNCAEASQVLGHVLSQEGRPEEAITAYQVALRHRPDLPGLHNDIALALRQADQLEAAEAALREALRCAPDDGQVQSNLASVLKELGRLDEAEICYREALRGRPDDAALHFNLALVLLLAGRFAEGWDEYEWRFRAGAVQLRSCPKPRWDGEALAGRTLLVRAEQGLGSTIQFCRYLEVAAARGSVVLEVQPGLRRLLAQSFKNIQIVTPDDMPAEVDCYCPMLSLPRLFGMQPPQPPYLAAEPDRVRLWQARLGTQGRKIGIAWQGNPDSTAEHGRSIPLHEFTRLTELTGVRLISLQKHHGLEQLAVSSRARGIETLPEPFDAGPDAFLDTAAIMQCLDLVITSDTSIAHLAGALGRPVWVGLQQIPDWRWLLHGEDCRWYPTMRLFRQTRRGDWAGVFTRITARLAATASLP
jgi:tetratricopeptide (TPR) repeat protein